MEIHNTPVINANDDKVQIIKWYIEPKKFVKKNQSIVDLETSKAVFTVTSSSDGYILPLINVGTIVKVGTPLYKLTSKPIEFDEENINENEKLLSSDSFSNTRFSKKALALINEEGKSKDDFKDAGLISAKHLIAPRQLKIEEKKSIKKFSQVQNLHDVRSEATTLSKEAEIETLSLGEYGNINSRLNITFNAHAIIERLKNEDLFDGNIQPIILFEIAQLLKKWPQFTAYYDNQKIHYYDRVHLGLAFDLGKGLKVVTIKDAEELMPINLFENTLDIGLRYLDNKISSEELQGSTITITDLSGFNILDFDPLINGNQSTIIGIGGDQTKPGKPYSIIMTFDHRVSNGREVAIFLNELRERILSYEVNNNSTDGGEEANAFIPENNLNQCDLCGINLDNYYKKFGKTAFMIPYYKEDYTIGKLCANCFSGWI
jgi:pyruvate/2-oxoglutarate dehydrogenase complex dihydrolipoamide acyltransferase (E2) component